MDYYEEDNGAAGSIPEFGAIFMSSTLTMKECLEWNVFALPSSKAEFVKQVKAGMVLFLLEFEKRKLYGVYQATSDGTMDIVPHGFNYSGRHFPAQVSFTTVWHCNPLSEKDFRDAIRENYFSAKKFNFGLSEYQVRRLLSLFSSRKLHHKLPPRLLTEVFDGAADRGMVDDGRFQSSQRTYVEPGEYDEFDTSVLCVYRGSSLTKAEQEELLIEDEIYPGNIYSVTQGNLTKYHRNILSKKRRVDEGDCLLMNDSPENEIRTDHCAFQSMYFDPSKTSLDDVKRASDGHRSLTVERACNENQGDRSLNPVLSTKYRLGAFDVGKAGDDWLMQRDRVFGESNMDSGFEHALANETYLKCLNKSRKYVGVDRFLIDDCAQRDYSVHECVKPVVCSDGIQNILARAREFPDDRPCSRNGKLENRYHLDCDSSPPGTSERFGSLLGGVKKTTGGGGRFPINSILDNEPHSGPCSLAGFSSESFGRPSICDHWAAHDAKPPIGDRRVTENMMDNILCSSALIKNAEYIASVSGQVNDGWLRKTNMDKNLEHNHEFVSTVASTEYPTFSKPKQKISSFSDNHLSATGLSRSALAQHYNLSHATCNDSTITRANPYTPEYPNMAHGFSVPQAADLNSSLARDSHPYSSASAKHYSLSNSRSPAYLSGPKNLRRSLDAIPESGNKSLPTNAAIHQSSLLNETTNSSLKSNLSEHMVLNTSAPVDYRGSLFPKPSLTSFCSADHESFGKDKGLSFAYPSTSSENHFALDASLPTASQCMSQGVSWPQANTLDGKEFLFHEATGSRLGVYHQENDFAINEKKYLGISNDIYLKEHKGISEARRSNSNGIRTSVFSRLTSGQEVQVGEERDDRCFSRYDSYMDASADEVMEMLQQCNGMPSKKLRKSVVVGQPKHGESSMDKNHVESYIEINNSTVEKKEVKDSYLGVADCNTEVSKETRILNFKRRSETKKSAVGVSSDSVTDDCITGLNGEVANSMKRIVKRKKLVRPVFWKFEPAAEVINSNTSKQLSGHILGKDDGQKCEGVVDICEATTPNGTALLSDATASHNLHSSGCIRKEHPNSEELKNLEYHVLSSISHELKEHVTSPVDLQTGFQVPPNETSEKKCFVVRASESLMAQDLVTIVGIPNLEKSSSDGLKFSTDFVNSGEEKKPKVLKRKKKIIKTSKARLEVSQ